MKTDAEPYTDTELLALRDGLPTWAQPTPVRARLMATIDALKDEAEQLRVQLAGCTVAALGYTSEALTAKPGDYGWSASYGDVQELRSLMEHERIVSAGLREDLRGIQANYAKSEAQLEEMTFQCADAANTAALAQARASALEFCLRQLVKALDDRSEPLPPAVWAAFMEARKLLPAVDDEARCAEFDVGHGCPKCEGER